jgi:hypothetical protein
MRQDFEVESVVKSNNSIRVGIIVYRKFQPPVTVVFEKRWSEEIRYISDISRADGSGINAPVLSQSWLKYAKIFAITVIKDRLQRRDRDFFWATQPRLF